MNITVMRALTVIFFISACIYSLPTKAQVLAEGAEQLDTFMGYRARSFNNTGGGELYLGVPDLGIGSNRSEANFVWANDGLTLFTVEYSKSLNTLYFSTENTQTDTTRLVSFPNWLSQTNAINNVNLDEDSLNYMTITVTARDNNQSVLITDMQLNGVALQENDLSLIGAVDTDPSGAGSVAMYSVSDFCFVNNEDDGFILAGNLSLTDGFSNSQERSKVDIQVGFDPNGPECSGMIFRDSYEDVPNYPS